MTWTQRSQLLAKELRAAGIQVNSVGLHLHYIEIESYKRGVTLWWVDSHAIGFGNRMYLVTDMQDLLRPNFFDLVPSHL